MTLLLLLLVLQQDEIRIRSGPYQPGPVNIAVETNLVEVGVVVRDHQGQPAAGLQASSFELLDNGKPQKIAFFSEQKSGQKSDLPDSHKAAIRSIVLFFDDTHTDRFSLPKGRDAAKTFLSAGVHPGDRIAILTTSGAPSADFTADIPSLLPILDQLKPHPEVGARGIGACPTLNPYQAYAILTNSDMNVRSFAIAEAINCNCGPEPTPQCIQTQEERVKDAAVVAWSMFKPQSSSTLDRIAAVIHQLSGQPGSRTLILVSPGLITWDLEQKTSALVDAALRARIVINGLDSAGLSASLREGDRKPALTQLMSTAAVATGGQFLSNTNDLSGGLKSLAELAAASYILGFSPGDPDDKYHPLKVALKGNYHVAARPGYFSTRSGQPVTPIQQRIDRLVFSADSIENVPATVQVSAKDQLVQIDINVDATKLKFSEQGDVHVQQLTFVTVVLDSSGKLMEGKQAVVDIAVKPAKLAELQSKGIEATTSFSLPKGSYQIREVIREALENRMTAVNTPVIVP